MYGTALLAVVTELHLGLQNPPSDRWGLVLLTLGWSWISSLWSAMKCPVVCFGVSMGLAWL